MERNIFCYYKIPIRPKFLFNQRPRLVEINLQNIFLIKQMYIFNTRFLLERRNH